MRALAARLQALPQAEVGALIHGALLPRSRQRIDRHLEMAEAGQEEQTAPEVQTPRCGRLARKGRRDLIVLGTPECLAGGASLQTPPRTRRHLYAS